MGKMIYSKEINEHIANSLKRIRLLEYVPCYDLEKLRNATEKEILDYLNSPAKTATSKILKG